jgi:hypothetical protein
METITIEQQIRALGGEGILTPHDIDDFKASEKEVLMLMIDGQWHDAEEIRIRAGESGVPASEGLRRLRALYPVLQVENRVKAGATRMREYRAIKIRRSNITVIERILEEYTMGPIRAWLTEVLVATVPTPEQRRIPLSNILRASKDSLLDIIHDTVSSHFNGSNDEFIAAFETYWNGN